MRSKNGFVMRLLALLIAACLVTLAGCSVTPCPRPQIPPLPQELSSGPSRLIPLQEVEREIESRSMGEKSPARQ